MAEEIKKTNTAENAPTRKRRFGGDGKERRGAGTRRSSRRESEGDGFGETVLDLRRVTRVVAGGKRFRFRATVVVGDGKGTVGVGVAKGADVQQAIQKAKSAAKRALITFRLINGTIAHEVKAKFSAAEVLLRPAKEGHGLMAGGAVRAIMSLSGVKDVTAKCLGGTKNKLMNALATVEALKKLKTSK
ncbi:MAG: 30S ribosomal protein S5 [Parcubacteria group bacterium]